VALLEESRLAVGRAIDSILTSAYWEIGRRIVVEEQRGRRQTNYGEQLVEQLVTDLTARFGKSFSRTGDGFAFITRQKRLRVDAR
jgi:hypothetical protein